MSEIKQKYVIKDGHLNHSTGAAVWCYRFGEGGHHCGQWCAAFQEWSDVDGTPLLDLFCCKRTITLDKSEVK